jgi:glycosyltransferase involved in cell wall biosynthesis
LSKEKGGEILIEAFSMMTNTEWKLVLAGDGPEHANLLQLVDNLNLEKRVQFLGKVIAVDALLAQSAIFMLPSFLEGFPNALCEAMSAGLPAICFDCIPHEELIENGVDGFVVKDGDLNQLASVLDFLSENEEYRNEIGQNALKINEKLIIQTIGHEYLNFICKTQ